MQSDWKDPETGTPIPPRTVYLAIQQTAVSLAVRLLTDESTSDLLNGQVATQPSGYPALTYTYRNEPALALQQTRSQIHHGSAMINIIGDPAEGSKATTGPTARPPAPSPSGAQPHGRPDLRPS